MSTNVKRSKRSFIRWCRERANHLLSHPRLTDGDKAVGVEIINRANWETGGYHVRLVELAAATGRTVRSVQRSIRRLGVEGLLYVQVNRGLGYSNYYWPLPAWTDCAYQNTTQRSYLNTTLESPLYSNESTATSRDIESLEATVRQAHRSNQPVDSGLETSGNPRQEGKASKEEGSKPSSGVPPSSASIRVTIREVPPAEPPWRVPLDLVDARDTVADIIETYGTSTVGGVLAIGGKHGRFVTYDDLQRLQAAGAVTIGPRNQLRLRSGFLTEDR